MVWQSTPHQLRQTPLLLYGHGKKRGTQLPKNGTSSTLERNTTAPQKKKGATTTTTHGGNGFMDPTVGNGNGA
eukprot:5057395-Prorocentrum_lima.AAC.1